MGSPPRRTSRSADLAAPVARTRPGIDPATPAAAPTRRDREAAIRAARSHLEARLPPDVARGLRRVAREGGRPGWDLEYRDRRGERVAVLVRGTAAPAFDAVEVTAVEWTSAKRLGIRYWLVLVADVRGKAVVGAIQNPAGQVQDRTIDAHPTSWRLTWPALDRDEGPLDLG